MKYLLAVSGGVDSVVLLDQLARCGKHELAVAHVDHGMRADAAADARFVAALAQRYELPFYLHEARLGQEASEESARRARYTFLFGLSERYGGQVVTAHHADDVIETAALNIMRGTRWRGLAGMGDKRIIRPLITWTKRDIYEYALRHHLEWVEDDTNASNAYTRNRLRRRIATSLSASSCDKLLRLWRRQHELKAAIERECAQHEVLAMNRYAMSQIDLATAGELLHEYVRRSTGVSLLSKQREMAVLALRTGRPGTTWRLARHVEMKLSLKSGIIKRVD